MSTDRVTNFLYAMAVGALCASVYKTWQAGLLASTTIILAVHFIAGFVGNDD